MVVFLKEKLKNCNRICFLLTDFFVMYVFLYVNLFEFTSLMLLLPFIPTVENSSRWASGSSRLALLEQTYFNNRRKRFDDN